MLLFTFLQGTQSVNIGNAIGGATANAVLYIGSDGQSLSNSSNLTYDGTTLTVTGGPIVTAKLSESTTAGAGLTIAAGTATTAVNALSVTGTWNAAGVSFTGLLVNITKTAAAAGSRIFDFQKDSATVLTLRNSGASGNILTLRSSGTTDTPDFEMESSDSSRRYFSIGGSLGNALGVVSGYPIGFSSSATNVYAGLDTAISRTAAGVVAVGTGAQGSVAGTLSAAKVQSGAASNLVLAYNTTTTLTIGANLGVTSAGWYATTAPNTQTGATYTVADTDSYIIANRAGTVTLTLPTASSFTGRRLVVSTIQNQTVVSASSNVVPAAGGAAGTAILAGTAGKFAELISDGTNWQIMGSN